MNWLIRLLTRWKKSDSVYLLSSIHGDTSTLKVIDRHTRDEVYKKIRYALGQLRQAISSRSVVHLEFAAIELLTALDVLDGIKHTVESEKATKDKQLNTEKRKASTRRR